MARSRIIHFHLIFFLIGICRTNSFTSLLFRRQQVIYNDHHLYHKGYQLPNQQLRFYNLYIPPRSYQIGDRFYYYHNYARCSSNLDLGEQEKVNDSLADDFDDNAENDLIISTDEENEKINFDYTTIRKEQKLEDDDFFNNAEMDANRLVYPKGTTDGFYVIKQYTVPKEGFINLMKDDRITQAEIDRLEINGENITVPIALMLLDEEAYPSFSKARKACRKGYIALNRGPLIFNKETRQEEFRKDCIRARVGDRVYPGDTIGIQCRLHGGFYPGMENTKPDFELPVVYEDDHFAIVNKPAGIVCYSPKKQGYGLKTIRAALPFVLKPPKRGTLAIIRRPVSVHRLDKPTTGLLLVAKTKPAMVDLTRQFENRRVKKTYTAILNGIPSEPTDTNISTEDAISLGVSVDENTDYKWQLIDYTLDEKNAVTVWRPLRYVKSLKANNGILTLVELKPKTGRYHQLRRHMSWVKECPIVGDSTYDGGGMAMNLRGRGLMLCSNKVSLDHPYYNTQEGRAEWEKLPDKSCNGFLSLSKENKVEVNVSIDLPNKFESFLSNEGKREKILGDEADS